MTEQPLSGDQIGDIEARAAHLHEYGTLTDQPLQEDLDRLTGTEVPALVAHVRRLTAQLADVVHPHTPRLPDHTQLEAAARRALDSLADLILHSPDPGVEALGAQYELRHALLDAVPDIPTTRVWTVETPRYGDTWTRWSAPYDELSEDAHKDYTESVNEWGDQRAFRIVCATTTHVIEAHHEPGADGEPADTSAAVETGE